MNRRASLLLSVAANRETSMSGPADVKEAVPLELRLTSGGCGIEVEADDKNVLQLQFGEVWADVK
jgi:hypothetical protein